jgi:tetratricopeptide (TPR) repeat protein/predicted secreted protein
MRRLQKLFLLVVSLAAFTATALAQTVHWEPPAGSLAFGQTSELQLVFEGCAPKGDPVLPKIEGLQLQRAAGQSSQTFINNGTVTRTETLSYAARPTQRTDLTIPEFSVETDKGRLTVAAGNYSVGDATVGQSNVPLENVASSRLTAPKDVWSGEVFPITYSLNVGRRYWNSLGSNLPEWNPAPLTAEDWSKPDLAEAVINGDNRVVVTYKSRALLKAPGKITVNAATQPVNITTGNSGFGFFPRQNLEQYSITSTRPVINVRPLPGDAPATFNGAVGQFTLKSNVVPVLASVGEPITWTLTLAGTGNWPDLVGLPARSVSKDFRTVQPQAKRTPKEGALFEATLVEDVVLIPTRPGNYTLGPTTWSYFDPAKGEYQTITTGSVVVTVSPAVDVNQPTAPSPSGTKSADSGQPRPPALPGAIPRDPLPDDGVVAPPLAARAFSVALLTPVAALLAFWLWLAFRRARETDPVRPRREARNRLSATLADLRGAKTQPQIAALLLAWQKDTAILWQIPQAVPAATSFPASETKWIALWADTDRALYRDATPLPADWITRAETALHEHPVRAFSALQLFKPRNLFPFAALLVLGLLVPATTLLADDGRNPYERGDFPAAEQIWRKALAETPASPSAHHNLALALAQQNRWGEAAAHAAAAFAQQPGNPAIRWNLAFTLERAGYAPSVFSGFASSHPPHVLARQFSAPQWQVVAILAVVLAVIGGAFLLLRGYGNRARWLKITAIVALTLASLAAAAAAFSLRVYSPVNDARSAIVWRTTTLRSIPTEADTAQKTTSLSAGTVTVIDRTFLTDRWVHLAFSNGQTGWVRQEDLVPLWK